MGLDASGNKLNPVMPKYQMSQTDLANLVAYLKVLGKQSRVGVTTTSIDIGTILPRDPSQPERARTVQTALETYFSSINQTGGIYGRKINLHCFDALAGDTPEAASNFAWISCFESKEKPIIEQAHLQESMVIGAFSENPVASGFKNPNVFYPYPSLDAETLALTKFAVNQLKQSKESVVLITKEESVEKWEQFFRTAVLEVTILPVASTSNWRKLPVGKNDLLVIDGAIAPTAQIVQHLLTLKAPPKALISLPLTATMSEKPPYDGEVYFATRHIKALKNQRETLAYDRLRNQLQLSDTYTVEQDMALGSAILFVELLKRAGKELSHDRLVEEMEKLYLFNAGTLPPVSFTKNRRVGSESIAVYGFETGTSTPKVIQTLALDVTH